MRYQLLEHHLLPHLSTNAYMRHRKTSHRLHVHEYISATSKFTIPNLSECLKNSYACILTPQKFFQLQLEVMGSRMEERALPSSSACLCSFSFFEAAPNSMICSQYIQTQDITSITQTILSRSNGNHVDMASLSTLPLCPESFHPFL